MLSKIIREIEKSSVSSIDDLAEKLKTDTSAVEAALEQLVRIGYLSCTSSADKKDCCDFGSCASCAGCSENRAPEIRWYSLQR